MQRLLLRAAALVVLGSLAGCLAGCADLPEGEGTSATSISTADTVSAEDLLALLQVAQPDYSRPYERDRFGYGGDLDPDGDGCYTKREVLIRDSIVPVRIGSSCFVTGQWRSLYDARVTSDPGDLTIDHLVPLAEAWHAGAWRWPSSRLVAYGNDLGYRWSLLAVTQAVNEDKASDDPARWLPQDDRCTYVKAWIAVKARWSLTVDVAEKAALTRLLAGCADKQIERPGTPDVAALSGGM